MTSSIKLPLGLLALFLEGHPQAASWLRFSEEELRNELEGWVAPGGVWIESPGYQAASLDGMFLLAQALRNVTGRDYFGDLRFEATMEHCGFLLTPRDRRFPPQTADAARGSMTLPSIGLSGTCGVCPKTRRSAAASPTFPVSSASTWTCICSLRPTRSS